MAGKSRSRANALTHGLTATVIDLNEIRPDEGSISHADPAGNPDWTKRHVARTMGQLDRARDIEVKLRAEAAQRAATLWESDRVEAAEILGAKISRNPSGVVAELRQTPQGCAWLIARWNLLALMAKAAGGWNAEQKALAYDLLGVPVAMRTVPITHAVACGHHPLGTVLSPLEIAVDRLAELTEHTELVAAADAREQSLAKADCVDLPTPDLARLRRYDTALYRRLARLVELWHNAAPLPRPATTISDLTPQPVALIEVAPPEIVSPTAVAADYETNPTPTADGPDLRVGCELTAPRPVATPQSGGPELAVVPLE